ncbi:hypothetical protein LP419_17120 [Massilia sp. H-1]|nr:hypothetical protein LP419_17120 [Massilia sp. H-1]
MRVSAGSACSSAKAAPSYVLVAMQLPHWRCAAAVRMSFGPMADEAFIAAACERIAHCGEALRKTCLIPSDGLTLQQRRHRANELRGRIELAHFRCRQRDLRRHRSAAAARGPHRRSGALPGVPGARRG